MCEDRRGTVHNIEVEQNTVEEKQVDMVNINYFRFNSIHSVIIIKTEN